MKSKLSSILLQMVILCLIISCDGNKHELLITKWKKINTDDTYEFFKDKTFTCVFLKDGPTHTGVYQFINDDKF